MVHNDVIEGELQLCRSPILQPRHSTTDFVDESAVILIGNSSMYKSLRLTREQAIHFIHVTALRH